MAREHFFEAELEWTGVALGPVRDYAGYSREWTFRQTDREDLIGTAAPAFRGDATLRNPEDLLLAAVSACHALSFLAEAAMAKVEIRGYRDRCVARMAFSEGKMRIVEATLRPEVEGDGDLTDLHEKAHAACFIANSVNFPILIEPV